MRLTDPLRGFLTNIALFGGLSEKTLAHIAEMLVEEVHDRGDTIVRQGETGRSMYVVRSGEVIVCREGLDGARRRRMVRLGAGEFFGEMTLIDPQPRSATVIIEQPTLLYALTNRDLYQLYRIDVDGYVMVLQNICRELSRRLRRADTRISELATEVGGDDTLIGPKLDLAKLQLP